MNELESKIDSLLFLESKPSTIKKLAKVTKSSAEDVEVAIGVLKDEYEKRNGGVTVLVEGDTVQYMTASRNAEFIAEYLSAEDSGELTRPSLETLTIIAYRGPVAKSEIELIRGVNCSLILRNLMIRGLVHTVGETDSGSPIYRITVEFLRHLGISSVQDLPEYEELNKNVHLQEMLEQALDKDDFFSARSFPEKEEQSE